MTIPGSLRRAARLAFRALGPALGARLRPPVNGRGHALDPDLARMLRFTAPFTPPAPDAIPLGRLRALYELQCAVGDIAPRPVERVIDARIQTPLGHALEARVYVPHGAGEGARPGLVFLHGGGFTIGSIRGYDGFCRLVAERAGAVVFNCSYRLAPEHRFPAAIDDGIAAWRWARSRAEAFGVDPRLIAVGGDSAGANIAAVAAHDLSLAGADRPAALWLIYPATDVDQEGRYGSRVRFAKDLYLTEALMEWFALQYTGPEADFDPRLAPLRLEPLNAMPPALVHVAGFDPLRDEGERFAAELAEAGVPTRLRSCESMLHGFLNMGNFSPGAERAMEEMAGEFGDWMRERRAGLSG